MIKGGENMRRLKDVIAKAKVGRMNTQLRKYPKVLAITEKYIILAPNRITVKL